jgi:predicted alpha/beta-hydrolase family hydrolase
MSSVAPFAEGGVRGFLHRPDDAGGPGLVLAHGAGANCEAPVLVAAAGAFTGAGFCVLRCDLPFRQRRPKGPPSRGDAAADRAGLREAVGALGALVKGPVYLGGHSYGGRQASMLAAEEPGVAEALLLLSYPLHPPDKPAQLRTAHFPSLRTRAVFVHGTADGFATIAELEAAVAAIPAATRVIAVPGAGHDLKKGRLDFAEAVAALLGTPPKQRVKQ